MEQLKVCIRIRPFLSFENNSNTGIIIKSNDVHTLTITKSLKSFQGFFDKILPPSSTQKEVFSFIKPILSNIKKGINSTILTYGQTGSGKTYTMFGGDWAINNKDSDFNEKKSHFTKDEYNFLINNELHIDPFSKTNGIIPNLIMAIFSMYNININDNDSNNIKISCSYIQIYNEKVYDLLIEPNEIDNLNTKKFMLNANLLSHNTLLEKCIYQTPLKIKYTKNDGVILDGANEIRTYSFFDMFDLLSKGEKLRKIRQTNKNEMSSRSHTIFIINIEDNINKLKSKIKLCDLAGSERYDSNENYKKIHMNEMCNINKSLLILGKVINILGKSKKKLNNIFIPYKDSKLTQILEDSLSGNSSIYLIATISPNNENFEESVNTLKFADRAHEVMTSVSPNQIFSDDFSDNNFDNSKKIKNLCDELTELKQLLAIRAKRGNLSPIQEELLKLKKENSQLKKILGGENKINTIKKLINENNSLKQEIKNLTSQKIKILRNNSVNVNSIASNIITDKNKMISMSDKDFFKNKKINNINNINTVSDKEKKFRSKSNILLNSANDMILSKNNINGSLNGDQINGSLPIINPSKISGGNGMKIKEKFKSTVSSYKNENSKLLSPLERLRILNKIKNKNNFLINK